MEPTPSAHHSSSFQGKLQGTQGPTPSASETAARTSSQMSMEIHDKQQDSSSALTDPTEKVSKTEFYLSTVIYPFSLREGKRGCIAGLFGIKDTNKIVQEAELFMVAVRHVALKRSPHGALRFSRTHVQGFSGIPALEMSVNSSESTQN